MQVVIFNIKDSRYAVDITYVEEIFKSQKVTSLPGSGSKIVGVTNIRGSILPMVDGGILEHTELLDEDDTRVIVLSMLDKRLGLIVESVREIINVESDLLETLQISTASGYVKQVIKHGDEIIQLIVMEDFFKYLSGNEVEDLARDVEVEEEFEVV